MFNILTLLFSKNDLRTGLEKFKATYSRYPTTEEGLSILIKCTKPDICKYFPPAGFISKETLSDPWGTPYAYSIDSKAKITIKSLGSDAKPGGEGCGRDINIATERYECADLDRFDILELLKGFGLFLPLVTLMLPFLVGWYYFRGNNSYWWLVSVSISIILTAGAIFFILSWV